MHRFPFGDRQWLRVIAGAIGAVIVIVAYVVWRLI
jgi:hypothetical protein